MSGQGTKIGLFWSGKLGGEVARLHERLLRETFPHHDVFISTNINPGNDWFHQIHAEINETAIGLFFLAPDSLESPWIAYECGQLARATDFEAIVPVRIGVSQAMCDARVPVLAPHNASEFGTAEAFAALCQTCADRLNDRRPKPELTAAAKAAWSRHEAAAAALKAAALRVLPNPYVGLAKHSTMSHSNFRMPWLFELIEREFFLVGINHAYVLNVRRDPTNFIALMKWLIAPGTNRRAKFLISDMWNPAVFECYSNLIHSPIAKGELNAFTALFKSPGSQEDIEQVIAREVGEAQLTRIRQEKMLEIHTYATILDTFWFVDKGSGQGRCQLSPANAIDGGNRPFFFAGEEDQPTIFNYYYGLAEMAFGAGEQLWPRPPASAP
jgi:hypothetical protein